MSDQKDSGAASKKTAKKRPKEDGAHDESSQSKKRRKAETSSAQDISVKPESSQLSQSQAERPKKSTSAIPFPVDPNTLPSKPTKPPSTETKTTKDAKKPKIKQKKVSQLQQSEPTAIRRQSTTPVPMPIPVDEIDIPPPSKPTDKQSKKRQKNNDSQQDIQIEESQGKAFNVNGMPKAEDGANAEEAATKEDQDRDEDEADEDEYPPLAMPEGTDQTGMQLITANMYLPVPPIAIKYSLAGAVADAVSPLLLTYHPPFRGVVLGHANARATEGAGATSRIIEQYGSSFLWVTLDVLVFRPFRGAWLQGCVTLQCATHINLIVWNFFSARIERKRMPPSWRFIPDEAGSSGDTSASQPPKFTPLRRRFITGTYCDRQGNPLPEIITFQSLDFDVSVTGGADKSLISIEGTLMTKEQEKSLEEKRKQKRLALRLHD